MQLKSHRTVEQIARKHRMDVSDIQKQLDMGIPIEHEHTRNKTLATDIALQHLDEFPDYYTRLKKMEADAKKEHKKFKDVKEDAVTDLQRGIVELPDASYDSIDSLMRRIMKKRKMSAKQLHDDFVDKHNQTPDTWAKKNMKEDLRIWFGKDDEGGVGGGGWDRYNTKGERIGKCARENPNDPKPKCLSKKKASQLRSQGGSKAIANAVRRKREDDPVADRPGKGGKPIMVSNKIKEEYIQEKNVPTNPSLWSRMKSRAKSKFDVYPSAYANGWAAKEYKKAGGGWKTINESNFTQEAANAKQQAAIAIKMKEKGIKPESEMKEDCWAVEQKGMKKKGKKMVPNCVPVKEESGVRYCPKCAKEETRDECKYGQKYWDMFSMPITLKDYTPNTPHPGNMPEEKDHEYSMARSELNTIANAAKRLKKKMKGEGNIEAWVQSKITKAADYIDTAADYIDSRESKVNEDITIEDANGNTFIRIIDIIKADRLVREGISPTIPGGKSPWNFPVLPKENPENVPLRLIKGKEQKLPLAKGEGGSPYEPYNAPKEDPKNPYVPAPKRPKLQLAHYEFEDKTLSQFMIEASAAWQRKEGKNPEGGLNAKGRASAKAQGHNLKPPVTTPPSKLDPDSKSAKRRKSFCARMGGMPGPMKDEKGRPTRKALSLRKWNC